MSQGRATGFYSAAMRQFDTLVAVFFFYFRNARPKRIKIYN